MITSRAFKLGEVRDRHVCSIGAAILGSSAIGAIGSIWGSSNAADAQTQAAQMAIAAQKQMYAKNSANLSPFIAGGNSALPQLENWLTPTTGSGPNGQGTNALQSLLSLVTPGPNQNATLAQTPGYQFSVDQGTRAALNALAARGLGGSAGAIAKGVGGYVSGIASQNYNNDVSNLLNTYQTGAGTLQNLVNSGVTAGSSLAGVGTNTANAIGSSITGAGNAQAAAYNSIGSAIGNVGNAGGTAALLQQLTGGAGGSVYGSGPSAGPMTLGGPDGPVPFS